MTAQMIATPDQDTVTKSYHDSFRARARTAATYIIGVPCAAYMAYKTGEFIAYDLNHSPAVIQNCLNSAVDSESCKYKPPMAGMLTGLGAGAVSTVLFLAEALQGQKDDNGNYVDNWGPYPADGRHLY